MLEPPTVHEPIYAEEAGRAHALRLTMWVFLASETLLFAGLFALYASYRTAYAADFAAAAAHNEELIGSLNTFVLISSSFCVAFALHLVRLGRRAGALVALGGTILLGLAFLGLKSLEYADHIAEGIVPGAAYAFAALPSHGARLFYTLYYVMTGLHALHVVAGLAIMAWLAVRVRGGGIDRERHVPLELGALYWHLVDIVWIFLWPLLYLVG
jgi:cytochrome c oxidase subunit 3